MWIELRNNRINLYCNSCFHLPRFRIHVNPLTYVEHKNQGDTFIPKISGSSTTNNRSIQGNLMRRGTLPSSLEYDTNVPNGVRPLSNKHKLPRLVRCTHSHKWGETVRVKDKKREFSQLNYWYVSYIGLLLYV